MLYHEHVWAMEHNKPYVRHGICVCWSAYACVCQYHEIFVGRQIVSALLSRRHTKKIQMNAAHHTCTSTIYSAHTNTLAIRNEKTIWSVRDRKKDCMKIIPTNILLKIELMFNHFTVYAKRMRHSKGLTLACIARNKPSQPTVAMAAGTMAIQTEQANEANKKL